MDESVSMAVLTMLERLTPAQRVSFVLHDVFGFAFAEIADITGRSAGACRELASAARRKVHSEERYAVARSEVTRCVRAFKVAWRTGDVSTLASLLADNAVATVDGGGRVSAALEPLTGAEAVAGFFVSAHQRQPDLELRETSVNGSPGLIAVDGTGAVLATISFELGRVGISRLWVVRNPAKLTSWSAAMQ